MSAYRDVETGFLRLDGDLVAGSSLYFQMPQFPNGVRQVIYVIDAEFYDDSVGSLADNDDDLDLSGAWPPDQFMGFGWSTSIPASYTDALANFLGSFTECVSGAGGGGLSNRAGYVYGKSRSDLTALYKLYRSFGKSSVYEEDGTNGAGSAKQPVSDEDTKAMFGYFRGAFSPNRPKLVFRIERNAVATDQVQVHTWITNANVTEVGMQVNLDSNAPFGYLPEKGTTYEVHEANADGETSTNWIDGSDNLTPPDYFHARLAIGNEDISWAIRSVAYQYSI